MEVKDGERTSVAKPVASRPCSTFRSFSELLVGAVNDSPPIAIAETTVAIRPKTTRFKPSVNHSSVEVVSSLDGLSDSAFCNSSDKASVKNPIPDDKSTVIYKPMPKLVSKSTASLLVNLGNFDVGHQGTFAQQQNPFQVPDQRDHHYHIQQASNSYHTLPSQSDINIVEPSKFELKNAEQNSRAQQPTSSSDRLSYDGYNWRKYGQKQVKGSEYPRSYYKCTHPNCPVKKKVERSLDGKIAEIVYKGEHNHPKPQPPKRLSSGSQGKAFVPDGSGRDDDDLLWSDSLIEKIEASDCRMDNPNEVVFSVTPSYPRNILLPHDSVIAKTYDSGVRTPETSCGLSGDCEEGSNAVEADPDEPNCKRRKNEDQASRVDSAAQGVQEPHVVVQSSVESDVMRDGFRWRKYGQKVVKGNPFPRSYYRCTSLKCNVRKHVERASDDPKSVITTYEGKHNHDMPAGNPHAVVSEPDSLAPTYKA